jgi:hypothetical protein
MEQVGANRLLAASNPGEMALGPQRNDAAATGAAETLEQQSVGKTIEIAPDETVTPEPLAAAAPTAIGPRPGKTAPQQKNVLEQDRNMPYHNPTTWKQGLAAPSHKGRRVRQNSPPVLFLRHKKRPFEEDQII